MDEKEDKWLGRCEKINALLNDGLEVIRQILGPRDAVEGIAKDADCSADKLDVELAVMLSSAQDLVDELKRVAMRF